MNRRLSVEGSPIQIIDCGFKLLTDLTSINTICCSRYKFRVIAQEKSNQICDFSCLTQAVEALTLQKDLGSLLQLWSGSHHWRIDDSPSIMLVIKLLRKRKGYATVDAAK
jgi:hypothetical protein